MTAPFALVHLDESCLGNGREGDNPGGAGGLVERDEAGVITRRDLALAAPATTNNRMALEGAIAVLEALAAEGRHRLLVVSDSQYLVKGMTEWVPGWIRRGWRRQGGPIENLALWQRLVDRATLHEIEWTWVKGHAGHPKNEYVNDLAMAAAGSQQPSGGLIPSNFESWLAAKRAKGLYLAYDPDRRARAPA
ncbi:MAG: ribonuclease H [Gemmatimonadales bacterium]|nr:ribonuclease H [Gemmatimonadales bacterium]